MVESEKIYYNIESLFFKTLFHSVEKTKMKMKKWFYIHHKLLFLFLFYFKQCFHKFFCKLRDYFYLFIYLFWNLIWNFKNEKCSLFSLNPEPNFFFYYILSFSLLVHKIWELNSLSWRVVGSYEFYLAQV